jgi:hypothetical protein
MQNAARIREKGACGFYVGMPYGKKPLGRSKL